MFGGAALSTGNVHGGPIGGPVAGPSYSGASGQGPGSSGHATAQSTVQSTGQQSTGQHQHQYQHQNQHQHQHQYRQNYEGAAPFYYGSEAVGDAHLNPEAQTASACGSATRLVKHVRDRAALVRCVAHRPNTRRLIMGLASGEVVWYNEASLKQEDLKRVLSATGAITALKSLSERRSGVDRDLILLGDSGGKVHYLTQEFMPLKVVNLYSQDEPIYAISLNCTETEAVIGMANATPSLIDVETAKVTNRFSDLGFATTTLQHHPTRDLVVAGSSTSVLQIWDTRSASPLITASHSVRGGITSLEWHPHNEFLFAAAAKDQVLYLFDVRFHQGATAFAPLDSYSLPSLRATSFSPGIKTDTGLGIGAGIGASSHFPPNVLARGALASLSTASRYCNHCLDPYDKIAVQLEKYGAAIISPPEGGLTAHNLHTVLSARLPPAVPTCIRWREEPHTYSIAVGDAQGSLYLVDLETATIDLALTHHPLGQHPRDLGQGYGLPAISHILLADGNMTSVAQDGTFSVWFPPSQTPPFERSPPHYTAPYAFCTEPSTCAHLPV